MLDRNEPRHIFMAISFGILVLTPVILLVLPSFVANAIYQESNTWVIVVPGKVYLLYGLGLLFLYIATLFLWIFSVNKKSKWLAAICVLLTILVVADGSGRYVGVSTDGVSFKRGIMEENRHYAWNTIQHAVYTENRQGGGFPKFDFHFNDGEMVTLTENRSARIFHNTIRKTLQKEEVEVQRK